MPNPARETDMLPFVEASMMLDAYGALLTDKQREVLELRFMEDLSLSEISSMLGVSRQAAQDAVTRGETILRDLENKLGIVKRRGELVGRLEKLKILIDSIDGADGAALFLEDILLREKGEI
ncbi:MAG: hypothetical protein LBD16_02370 [Oscillospiraceae bacterium]|nr:hypothetical protein [Oscillospiraceae bacterium]